MTTPKDRMKPYPFKSGKIPPDAPRRLVLVCGSRDYEDWPEFKKQMDDFLYWKEIPEFLIGGLGHRIERDGEWFWRGADYFANEYSRIHWIVKHLFHPNWEADGKAAGPIRNKQMAVWASREKSSSCIAFWDGKSPGTRDMIANWKRYCDPKRLRVVRV